MVVPEEGALITTLRSVPFLENMSAGERAGLVHAAREVHAGRGEFICQRGDVGDRMWVLTEGSVEVIATADWEDTGVRTDRIVALIDAPG